MLGKGAKNDQADIASPCVDAPDVAMSASLLVYDKELSYAEENSNDDDDYNDNGDGDGDGVMTTLMMLRTRRYLQRIPCYRFRENHGHFSS